MKRIWINKKYISSIATTIIGGIYAFSVLLEILYH